LAFDKLRAGTRPEEIKNMFEHIKVANLVKNSDLKRQTKDDIG
jgi:hypothetical protein